MPRLCLIDPWRGAVPPNGFRYVDPVDGFVSHAWDYRTWVEQQEKHLTANQREIPPDLGEQMQEQLCLTLPAGWCLYDDPSRPRPVPGGLEWGDIQGGLSTFTKWIAGGCSFVDQKEAERRAEICTRCYFNMNVAGCAGCQRLVTQAIGGRTTRSDNSLRGCGVCKCMLRAKVHFPISTLDTETEKLQSMYPEHCWLRKTGPNYVGD